MSVGTADLTEIVWTLAALPGLVLWLANRVEAGRGRRAVMKMKIGNGRLVWAQFSVLLTNVFVVIELVLVVVGAIAMSRSSPAEATALSQIVVGVGFAGASCLITFVGYRWRAVDTQIVAAARARRSPPAEESRK